jgi:hypothetical protein
VSLFFISRLLTRKNAISGIEWICTRDISAAICFSGLFGESQLVFIVSEKYSSAAEGERERKRERERERGKERG